MSPRAIRVLLAAAAAAALVLLSRHAPPFREVSDGAILEIYTLEALRGKLLLGPYSRFGWHHPGPLYFYLQAPWYWLSGLHTAGMQAGALAINAAAAALIAWVLAAHATSVLALFTSLAVAFYAVRCGDLLVSVWNPHVIVLPMLAFLIVAAGCAASGRRALVLWLVALGSLLVQTHVAMAPVVASAGVFVLAAQFTAVRRAAPAAGLLAVVLWLPAILEQLTHRPGNVVALATFFTAGAGHGSDAIVALTAWASALTDVFRPSFTVANGLDFQSSAGAARIMFACVQLTLLIPLVLFRATRIDVFTRSIAFVFALSTTVALWETGRIHDRIVDHEVFWISALGAVNAALMAACLAEALRLRLPESAGRRAAAAVVAAAAAVGAAGMQHVMTRSRTPDDHAVDVLVEAIEQRIAEERPRRILFHIEPPIWTIAAGALLQIDKARVRFAVDDRWTTMFGEAFTPNGREDLRLTISGSPRQPVLIRTP